MLYEEIEKLSKAIEKKILPALINEIFTDTLSGKKLEDILEFIHLKTKEIENRNGINILIEVLKDFETKYNCENIIKDAE